jgi:hypothetical protein
MPHKKSNQTGFAAVAGLLIVIIVLLVGGTGYYVWHTNRQANNTLNSASTAASQPATGHSFAKMTGNQAAAFVQATYDNYLNAVNQALAKNATANADQSTQPVEVTGLAAVKKDLSPDFYKQITPAKAGEDKIGCALYAVDSYKANLLNVNSDGTAVVGVDIHASGSVNGTITATVNLTTKKITQITCPA